MINLEQLFLKYIIPNFLSLPLSHQVTDINVCFYLPPLQSVDKLKVLKIMGSPFFLPVALVSGTSEPYMHRLLGSPITRCLGLRNKIQLLNYLVSFIYPFSPVISFFITNLMGKLGLKLSSLSFFTATEPMHF